MESYMLRIALLLAVAVSLSGCKNAAPKPTPAKTAEPVAAPVPPSPASEARKLFTSRCVVCHGSQGLGDGPGGAALDPKPRAFSNASWQSSVDDAHLAKVIVEGGAAVKLSPGMPPNPDLQSKPDVVAELVKIVRAFGK
jgi:mono/diheme cytochrome c family protein